MPSTVLVVEYHFVRNPEETPYPGLKCVQTETFERHLDAFCQAYEPLTANDFRRFFAGEDNLPAKGFYLTFDDGTRDHIEEVFPRLQRRGLEGAFFPVTEPLVDGRIVALEKGRFLQYARDDYDAFLISFYDSLCGLYPGLDPKAIEPTSENIADSHTYLSQYAFYSDEERFFRKTRDSVLTPEQFEAVMGDMFPRHFGDEKDFIREFYMSWEDLTELQRGGMVVGGHTHCHGMLGNLTVEQQREDIETCLRHLSARLPEPVDVFAFPFGNYNQDTLTILRDNEISISFTTYTQAQINRIRPFEIGRVDAAEVTVDDAEVTADAA